MAPRFGLTPAHVPSQPWGAASFVCKHGRKKEVEEEEEEEEEGMESCMDKCVKGHSPVIHFC